MQYNLKYNFFLAQNSHNKLTQSGFPDFIREKYDWITVSLNGVL